MHGWRVVNYHLPFLPMSLRSHDSQAPFYNLSQGWPAIINEQRRTVFVCCLSHCLSLTEVVVGKIPDKQNQQPRIGDRGDSEWPIRCYSSSNFFLTTKNCVGLKVWAIALILLRLLLI